MASVPDALLEDIRELKLVNDRYREALEKVIAVDDRNRPYVGDVYEALAPRQELSRSIDEPKSYYPLSGSPEAGLIAKPREEAGYGIAHEMLEEINRRIDDESVKALDALESKEK
jgi:hypothetical protein